MATGLAWSISFGLGATATDDAAGLITGGDYTFDVSFFILSATFEAMLFEESSLISDLAALAAGTTVIFCTG